MTADAVVETEAALWKPPPDGQAGQGDPLALLKATPLFSDLRGSDLKKILRMVHERSYATGQVVFHEGDRGAGMYIIKRGNVDITIRTGGGDQKVVASLTDRQFFGEMALLESAPRSATCVATAPTELLGFFQPDLDNLMDRNSRLGARVLRNLARLMAGRIRAMNERVRAQPADNGDTAASAPPP